jgi:hypothetical protein
LFNLPTRAQYSGKNQYLYPAQNPSPAQTRKLSFLLNLYQLIKGQEGKPTEGSWAPACWYRWPYRKGKDLTWFTGTIEGVLNHSFVWLLFANGAAIPRLRAE